MRFVTGKQRIPFSKLILFGVGIHLAVALYTYIAWELTGDDYALNLFFRYQGTIYFVACSSIELGMSLFAWRQFSPGEPLRRAWSLITMAAACHFAGGVFQHLLGSDSRLNPLRYCCGYLLETIPAESLHQFGLLVSGPLAMIFLGGGLWVVLRIYSRLGLLVRLTKIDFVLLFIVILYTLRFVYELIEWFRISAVTLTLNNVFSWASDPLLCLLLLEAIYIRRAVINMGGGLIARCWGAFTVAIFITSVGDIGLWDMSHGYLSAGLSALTWYVWFLASAAFALAPTYQVEVLIKAHERLEEKKEDEVWQFSAF